MRTFAALASCLRFVVSLAVLGGMLAVPVLADQEGGREIELFESHEPGSVDRVELHLEVAGDLKFVAKDKVEREKMGVTARFVYDEKLLGGNEPEAALCSIRHYQVAEASIKLAHGVSQPKLRNQRRRILCEVAGQRTTMFSPDGLLTRDELDLIGVLGNSLLLSALLPQDTVAVGKSWKHPAQIIGPFLGLDATASCEVESVLTDVSEGIARITMAGSVQGAAEGVSTEIDLKAKYHFDLNRRRITALNLTVKENRAIGHVGPGLEVIAKLKLTVEPGQESEALAEAKLAGVAKKAADTLTRLEHHSPATGIRFTHDRKWFVTSDEPSVIVLRRVDRGDLVAQCNISPLPDRSLEKRTSLTEFQKDIQFSLGKNFGRFVRAGQGSDERGQLVYRVVALGQVQDLPIQWHYYLVANENGRRAAVAVTVEAELADRLDNADRQLVGTLDLGQSKSKAAPQPQPGEKSPTAAKGKPEVKR